MIRGHSNDKIQVQEFQKSINASGFSSEEISAIWEFYVTKSISKSANQRRSATDYGWNQLPIHQMLQIADIAKDNCKILCATSIDGTLKKLDLIIQEKNSGEKQPLAIDIDLCRMACTVPFTIADEESPKRQISEAESLLTHIRNAFAHGLTYFFDNGNMLLEDRNQGKVTARILIQQRTLLDWIRLIDKDKKYYWRESNSESVLEKGA